MDTTFLHFYNLDIGYRTICTTNIVLFFKYTDTTNELTAAARKLRKKITALYGPITFNIKVYIETVWLYFLTFETLLKCMKKV